MMKENCSEYAIDTQKILSAPTDAELIRKIHDADEGALELFFERYADFVASAIHSRADCNQTLFEREIVVFAESEIYASFRDVTDKESVLCGWNAASVVGGMR